MDLKDSIDPKGAARPLPRSGRLRPRDLLAHLVAGDPYGLRRRARRALDEQDRLGDPDGLALAALAGAAHRAGAEGRSRLGDGFLEACLARALAESAHVPTSEQASRLPLGLPPGAVARACRAHDRQAPLDRRAFRLLVVEARDLDVVARQLGLDASATGRAARRVLDALVQALTPAHSEKESDHEGAA